MSVPRGRVFGMVVTVALLTAATLLPSSASAGQIVITGHDADDHCSDPPDQCHYFKVATKFARAGAPNPDRKVLLFGCNGGVRNALASA